ncbi:MAG: hypothetical protein IJF18_08100 [Oscillospiraceae bacterium]|nr:hypothetical protein [Oscillospiraceae bacterium]
MGTYRKSTAAVLAVFSSLCLFCGCSAGLSPDGIVTEEILTETVIVSETQNIIRSSPSVYSNNGDESVYTPEPFSSYTFEYYDGAEKYMTTISTDSTGDVFNIILEDSSFGFSETTITPPDDYILNIPYSQQTASSVCTVIRNTIDDTPVPDILEFTFYLSNFEDESLSYTVKKYYAVRDGELCEIKLVSEDAAGTATEMEYCSDYTLFHTEPLVFMPTPVVNIDENRSLSADVYTYTFDPDAMTMTRQLIDSSYESNPLYYCYKTYAAADYIAKYFTKTSLNVTDYENYVEVPSVNSDNNEYFFKVDDPRFGTVEELKDFTRKFFTEKLVSDMFINAPQKYRDIDGVLHTIVGDGGYDFTLGKITITEIEESGNTITVHTKQEKFTPEGKFDTFIDGGDFVIERNPEDDSFVVTQYRFVY